MSCDRRAPASAVALAVVACLAGVAAAAELWTDDFEGAKAQARKEGKDLLLDFTGSDWCGWCIRLKREVFDTERFKSEAPKKFVLVEVDFPHSKTLAETTRKQNAALQQQFGIQGYPTIVLLDAEGRAYAKTGYREGGEEAYLKHLDDLQKARIERDRLLAEAAKAQGVERARLLDKVIETLSKNGIRPMDNRAWVEEIINLDAKNEAGLKAKYEKMLRLAEAEQLAQSGKFEEAVKAIDKAIADFHLAGQEAQNALFLKSFCVFRKGDKPGAVAVLKAALEAAPQGDKADNIREAIRNLSQEK